MSPQLESMLTSALTTAFGGVIAWGSHGLISDADKATLSIALAHTAMIIGGAGGASLTTWWKQRQRSPAAIVKSAVEMQPLATARAMVQSQPEATIRAINVADNGVTVVATTPGIVPIEKPLKGPGS